MKVEDKIYEKLMEEHPITELISFSELDIQDKIAKNPYMIVKYKDLYHKELSHLDHLNDLLDKLIGKQYEFYRFECDREWQKNEIEKYCLPKDKKIIKMKNIIRKQEARVRFFDMCWRAFDKQGWSLKNFIDTIRGGY